MARLENSNNKNQLNGYAGLDATGKVSPDNLPASSDLSPYAKKIDTGKKFNLFTSHKNSLVAGINDVLRQVYAVKAVFPTIANLITDFDFSDESKVTVASGNISQITDSVGAVVSSQATAGNRPVYMNDGTLGNSKFARFDGTKSLSGALLTSNTEFTLFILMRSPTATALTYGNGVFQNGTANGYGIANYSSAVAGRLTNTLVCLPSHGITSGNGYTFANEWEVYAVSYSSSLGSKHYNSTGAPLLNLSPGAAPTTPTTSHKIGGMDSLVGGFKGDISRILLYDRQLTDAEASSVCRYFSDKNILDYQYNLVYGGHSKFTGQGGGSPIPFTVSSGIISDGYFIYDVNTSGGGSYVQTLIDNLTTNVINRYRPLTKNIYIVFIGCNDITTTAGTGATAYSKLVTLCTSVRNAGYQLIVLTETYSTVSSNTEIDVFNNSIRANWESFADAMVDAGALPHAANPSNTTYFSDGLHPTATLSAEIAALIKPVVETLLDS